VTVVEAGKALVGMAMGIVEEVTAQVARVWAVEVATGLEKVVVTQAELVAVAMAQERLAKVVVVAKWSALMVREGGGGLALVTVVARLEVIILEA
jgi:PHP family Zn ribbon phosphoesterase